MTDGMDFLLPPSNARQHRGSSWQPPGRSLSSPAFERATTPDRGGCETWEASESRSHRSVSSTHGIARGNRSTRLASFGSDRGDGSLSNRSPRSSCHSVEFGNRAEPSLSRDDVDEAKQLKHDVRALEGSLQARDQQVEQLVEQVRRISDATALKSTDATQSDLLLSELMEQITNVHADAYSRLDTQDRELQGALQDRLSETQQLSQRLAAKNRDKVPRSGAMTLYMEEPYDEKTGADSEHGNRQHGSRTPKSGSSQNVRRSSSQKSQELLKAYESTHMDLHRKMQRMQRQLEDERQARAEQELTMQRLAGALEERSKQTVDWSRGSVALSGINCDVDSALETTAPNSSRQTPRANRLLVRGAAVGGAAGGARALRQEFGALRNEERAHRAQQAQEGQQTALTKTPAHGAGHLPPQDGAGTVTRMLHSDPSASAIHAGEFDEWVSGMSGNPADIADRTDELRDALNREATLQEALSNAEFECAEWREAHAAECFTAQAAERLAAESEVALADATRIETELLEEVHAADARNWALAEVANEVAMRADLREMRSLQGELELQQELRASEQRCAMLQQVAHRAVAHAYESES